MTAQVAVVGVGGMGRRHLEALALSRHDLRVFVIDPNADSLAAARQMVSANFKNPAAVSFQATVERLPAQLDVAIVPTTASVRRPALEALLAVSRPRYVILEKILFQRLEDYDAVEKRLGADGIAAWVNTPRRLWPQYIGLRDEIADPDGLTIHATNDPAIGLGSNAIHMIDFLAFLSRADAVEVDASRLRLYDGPKKRGGIEFIGTLVVHTRRGSVLTYTTMPSGTNPLHFDIEWPNERAIFEETAGLAKRSSAANGWAWETTEVRPIFQSRLTNLAVDELIAGGNCRLPTYAESAGLHVALLKALIVRLDALGVPHGGRVEIT